MIAKKEMDIVLLLLRLTFGGAMIYGHGWGKVMRLFSGEPIEFFNFLGLGPEISLGLAAFAEVGCALLLIFGLFTRWASIPLIITMLVALFMVHLDDPFRQMEKVILYLVTFISLLIAGPGWYSIDEQFRS